MPHLPVLLRETINLLSLKSGDYAVDCTFGDGGHAQIILERLAPSSESRKQEIHFLGIDADPDNIARAKRQKEFQEIILVNDNFRHLKKIVNQHDFFPVNAILMDLGWSMTQFETSGRGFSFLKDEPLDMRYDTRYDMRINLRINANDLRIFTAAKIVNEWTEAEIGRILREYGEERNWRRIARAIVRYREREPIKTTYDLIKIIQSSEFRVRNSRLHPATKTFQALRLAVNDELNALKEALPQAVEILAPGGRLAVISFQSLEDRIVKQFFKQETKKGQIKVITKKPVIPGRQELKVNPRSRSAKLRVAERV